MRIFVFGSNRSGRHGAGAAKFAAQHHGAVYGVGEGLTGNTYAIPTKGRNLERLSLSEIAGHARRFMDFAAEHPELTFELTPIGCGLAGNDPAEIAKMFRGARSLPNVVLATSWLDYITKGDPA